MSRLELPARFRTTLAGDWPSRGVESPANRPRAASTAGAMATGGLVLMQSDRTQPCACGCGVIPSRPASKFAPGHNRRTQNPYTVDDSGCWLWKGKLGSGGYARIKRGGKTFAAHRLSYEQHHGPIPEGMQIDHLCRVRHCVNPDHLEAVTQAENVRRGAATKLTWDDVKAIRASSEGSVAIARRYEVTPTQIWAIRSHSDWAEPGARISLSRRKLTEDDYAEIRRLAATGMTRADIARQFGVSANYVCNIVLRAQREEEAA